MSYSSRYAARGMARPVDPGIDVSHYGAPYQGMLGLEGCMGCVGLGWVPGPGQTPRDDPRWLKRYSRVILNFAVSRVPSGSAGPDALVNKARGKFPGHTVREAWGNGWGSGVDSGRLGVEIILASPMRLGEIKGKSKDIEGALSGAGLTDARVSQAKTAYNAGDLMSESEVAAHTAGQTTSTSTTTTPPANTEDSGVEGENFLTQTAAGLPVWGWGLLGLGTLGAIGLVFAMTARGPAAVTANRQRRTRRQFR